MKTKLAGLGVYDLKGLAVGLSILNSEARKFQKECHGEAARCVQPLMVLLEQQLDTTTQERQPAKTCRHSLRFS